VGYLAIVCALGIILRGISNLLGKHLFLTPSQKMLGPVTRWQSKIGQVEVTLGFSIAASIYCSGIGKSSAGMLLNILVLVVFLKWVMLQKNIQPD
jgi:hypothetical protein